MTLNHARLPIPPFRHNCGPRVAVDTPRLPKTLNVCKAQSEIKRIVRRKDFVLTFCLLALWYRDSATCAVAHGVPTDT